MTWVRSSGWTRVLSLPGFPLNRVLIAANERVVLEAYLRTVMVFGPDGPGV